MEGNKEKRGLDRETVADIKKAGIETLDIIASFNGEKSTVLSVVVNDAKLHVGALDYSETHLHTLIASLEVANGRLLNKLAELAAKKTLEL